MKTFTSFLILGALLGVTIADSSFFSDLFGKIESNAEVQKAIEELKNIYNKAQASAEKLTGYLTVKPETVSYFDVPVNTVNETLTNILKYYHSSTNAFNQFSEQLNAKASKLISQSEVREKYLKLQNEVLYQVHDFYSKSILSDLVGKVENSTEVQEKINQLLDIYNKAKSSAEKLAVYLNDKTKEAANYPVKEKINETLTKVEQYYQSSKTLFHHFAEELNTKASEYLAQTGVREKYAQLQKQILQLIQDVLPLNMLSDLSSKSEESLHQFSAKNNATISEQ